MHLVDPSSWHECLHGMLNWRSADRTIPKCRCTITTSCQVATGHKDNVGLSVVADPAKALLAQPFVFLQQLCGVGLWSGWWTNWKHRFTFNCCRHWFLGWHVDLLMFISLILICTAAREFLCIFIWKWLRLQGSLDKVLPFYQQNKCTFWRPPSMFSPWSIIGIPIFKANTAIEALCMISATWKIQNIGLCYPIYVENYIPK